MKENKREDGALKKSLRLLYEKQPIVFINFIPTMILFFVMSLSVSLLLIGSNMTEGSDISKNLFTIAMLIAQYFYIFLLIVPPALLVVNIIFNVRHKTFTFFDNMLYLFGASTLLMVAFTLNMYLFSDITGMNWESAKQTMLGVVTINAPVSLVGFVVGKIILLFEEKVRLPSVDKNNKKR